MLNVPGHQVAQQMERGFEAAQQLAAQVETAWAEKWQGILPHKFNRDFLGFLAIELEIELAKMGIQLVCVVDPDWENRNLDNLLSLWEICQHAKLKYWRGLPGFYASEAFKSIPHHGRLMIPKSSDLRILEHGWLTINQWMLCIIYILVIHSHDNVSNRFYFPTR